MIFFITPPLIVLHFIKKAYNILGDFMFNIIERYISKLDKNDINNFAIKNNINLNDNELDFTYNFIKKNYKEVLSNPDLLNLDKYKDNYSEDNFIRIKKLFREYMQKYRAYL